MSEEDFEGRHKLPDLRTALVDEGDIYRLLDGRLIEVRDLYEDGVCVDVVAMPGGCAHGFLELSFDELHKLERLVLADWHSDVMH